MLNEQDLTTEKLKTEIFNLFDDENLKTALTKSNVRRGNEKIINEIKLSLR